MDDHGIKWNETTILAMDNQTFSSKMIESVEIKKHWTNDEQVKPLDSAWRALFTMRIWFLSLRAHELTRIGTFFANQIWRGRFNRLIII